MLVNEPYCLTLDQLSNLTDAQLVRVYFHPRTKDGTLDLAKSPTGGRRRKIPPVPAPETLGIPDEAFGLRNKAGNVPPAEFTVMFFQVWLGRGLPLAEVVERYKGFLAKGG